MRRVTICLAFALALGLSTSALADDTEQRAMAFCDGMTEVLTLHQGDCPAMARALDAHVERFSAFLKTSTHMFDANARVESYCREKLSTPLQHLATCLEDAEMKKVLARMAALPDEDAPQQTQTKREVPVDDPPRTVEKTPLPADAHPGLLDPTQANEKAPSAFKVRFETTAGDLEVEVQRAWAPNGADRFYNLVRIGYYDDVAFFRAIDGFMLQFGIHGHPDVNTVWREARIQDDPVVESNQVGMISFAMAGPNTRTTQLFINTVDNARLDSMGFAPFGRITSGSKVLARLYTGYGEGKPGGQGPDQGRVQSEGNTYLRADFPKLDYIKRARIVQ